MMVLGLMVTDMRSPNEKPAVANRLSLILIQGSSLALRSDTTVTLRVMTISWSLVPLIRPGTDETNSQYA